MPALIRGDDARAGLNGKMKGNCPNILPGPPGHIRHPVPTNPSRSRPASCRTNPCTIRIRSHERRAIPMGSVPFLPPDEVEAGCFLYTMHIHGGIHKTDHLHN